jgi:hypothetical protein
MLTTAPQGAAGVSADPTEFRNGEALDVGAHGDVDLT